MGADPLEHQYPEVDSPLVEEYSLSGECSSSELLGKFYQQTMTAEEFNQWKDTSMHEDRRQQLRHKGEQRLFLQQKEVRRLAEEQYESLRRRQVLQGEWTEADSHQHLRALTKQINNSTPTRRQQRLTSRINDYERVQSRKLRNPTEIHEREYYFAEGMGVSLEDHINSLKKNMPNAQIETRKDKDGFTILKTKLKPKYKYDLDILLGENKRSVAETADTVLQALVGGEEPSKESLSLFLNKENFALKAKSK